MKPRSELKSNFSNLTEREVESKQNFEFQKKSNDFDSMEKPNKKFKITSISSGELSLGKINNFSTFQQLESPENTGSNDDFYMSGSYQKNKKRMSKVTFGKATNQNSLSYSKKEQESEEFNDSLLNQLNKLKLDSVEYLNDSMGNKGRTEKYSFPEGSRAQEETEESDLLFTHSSESQEYAQKQAFFGCENNMDDDKILDTSIVKKPIFKKKSRFHRKTEMSISALNIEQTQTEFYRRDPNSEKMEEKESQDILILEQRRKDLKRWMKVFLIQDFGQSLEGSRNL